MSETKHEGNLFVNINMVFLKYMFQETDFLIAVHLCFIGKYKTFCIGMFETYVFFTVENLNQTTEASQEDIFISC